MVQYLTNPSGDVDGLLLADATVVRFPPHLGPALVRLVRPGEPVTVTGFRWVPNTVQATTIANDASHQSITDAPPSPGTPPPPPPRDAAPQAMSASGEVRTATYAPRGELDGAILTNGTVVHVPPHLGASFANLLVRGHMIAATGYGATNAYGKSLEATAIGPSPTQLRPVAPTPPPPPSP